MITSIWRKYSLAFVRVEKYKRELTPIQILDLHVCVNWIGFLGCKHLFRASVSGKTAVAAKKQQQQQQQQVDNNDHYNKSGWTGLLAYTKLLWINSEF